MSTSRPSVSALLRVVVTQVVVALEAGTLGHVRVVALVVIAIELTIVALVVIALVVVALVSVASVVIALEMKSTEVQTLGTILLKCCMY